MAVLALAVGLRCTYDIGPHADDSGNIEYTEVVLP